jgi:hypothetical protein
MKSPEPKGQKAPLNKEEDIEEDDDLMKDTEECPGQKSRAKKPLEGSVGTTASMSMSMQSPDNINNQITKQMT